MYDQRAERRAIACGIQGRMQALENDLLQIEGISDIDFDIDTYGDYEWSHVILVPRYTLDVERPDYYDARKAQLDQVLNVCERHDLHPSGDRIEDQGCHWYIVRSAGKSWPVFKNDTATRRFLSRCQGEYDDPKAMTPQKLGDTLTYCRFIDNPYAVELVTRAGLHGNFSRATTELEKGVIIRAAASSFGFKLF